MSVFGLRPTPGELVVVAGSDAVDVDAARSVLACELGAVDLGTFRSPQAAAAAVDAWEGDGPGREAVLGLADLACDVDRFREDVRVPYSVVALDGTKVGWTVLRMPSDVAVLEAGGVERASETRILRWRQP